MRPLCLCRLCLPILLVLLLILVWMPKERCYGCKNSYADLSNYLAKCKKAMEFQAEKSRLQEATKQWKVEEKRVKVAEAKERLAAQRAELEVEREASMPVVLEDIPFGRCQHRVPAKLMDMLPTSLKGLPHLCLKPGLLCPPAGRGAPAPTVLSYTSISGSSPLRPHATVEDVPDNAMEDVQEGTAPEGNSVKATKLGLFSMTPTRSAFSERFASFGCNVYKLFVPDLMHEFELGVWNEVGRAIGLEVRRAAVLNKIAKAQAQDPQLRKHSRAKARSRKGQRLQLQFQDVQPLPPTQPDQHHHISCKALYPVILDDFLYENEGDAACENFEHKLKVHLLHRLPGSNALPPDYVPTDDDLFAVQIEGEKLFQHKVLRVNYTRYDMWRDQDSINPRTHPDVMTLSPGGTDHPYLVARREDEDDTDWKYHYVGMFVDQDMFMWYYGGAVGHQCGNGGQPQPLSVVPESLLEHDGDIDDDEMEELGMPGGFAVAAVRGSNGRNEGSESENEGSNSEEGDSGGTDDLESKAEPSGEDEDDGALGPEDGEVAMVQVFMMFMMREEYFNDTLDDPKLSDELYGLARICVENQSIPYSSTTWACRHVRNFYLLPHFASLKPLELYTTAGLASSVVAEQQRFFENVNRDRDLLTLEVFAVSLRGVWMENQAEFEGMAHLHTEMWRSGFYPITGRPSEKVRWIYNHWWAGAAAWNVSMASLQPFMIGSTEVSPHDMDVCITHIMNTLETSGIILSMDHAVPFALTFLGLTPFGMWAHLLGHPFLALPMNGLQRTMLYLVMYISVGRQYQHLRYPATLQDKHSVANMLCAVHPRLEPAIEELH
ncbi:hypothetical protein V8D89_004165 [Ganoderma adspersum]